MKLRTMGWQSPKLAKSDKAGLGYLSCIMYLAPSRVSGHNVCPQASPGCIATCLNTAGRGRYDNVQQARINRTNLFFNSRDTFKRQLIDELRLFVKRAYKAGMKPACRLNGTSDLPWESLFPELFRAFPHVQFYDYTKVLGRKVKHLTNYHLTFSDADGNGADVLKAIQQGYNVATVFGLKKTEPMPATYNGRPVFNGDESDLRFLDPKGVIVGLYAKGRAKKDESGFVKYPTVMMKTA